MLRRIIAFVLACAVMVVAGSVTQTLFVQHAWSIAASEASGGAPAPIPVADRIAWIGHDLLGILVPFGAVTSVTMLVALLTAGMLVRYTGHRITIFGMAGAVGIFALFTLLRRIVGTVGIFGVRGPWGLAAQMLIACLAGVIFARLTRSHAGSEGKEHGAD
jgi:hypothetical protein